MSRVAPEILDDVTQQICEAAFKDYAAGKMTREDLEKTVRRNKAAIAEAVAERLRPGRAGVCCVCRAPATTVVHGKNYCDRDAATAPRHMPDKIKPIREAS